MYVITGASDGLGLALAQLLVARGERVVSLSRSKPQAKGVDHIVCDLTNEGSIVAAAEAVVKRPEAIAAFINCAGVFSEQPIQAITGKELAAVFTTNVIGPEILVGQLIERLKKDSADIVNVSSTAGLKGNTSQAAYCASKWALRGFSQVLQAELAGHPCRVISFCPGGMQTELFTKAQAAKDNTNWMKPGDVAAFMLQILALPKNMEISEVVINRK